MVLLINSMNGCLGKCWHYQSTQWTNSVTSNGNWFQGSHKNWSCISCVYFKCWYKMIRLLYSFLMRNASSLVFFAFCFSCFVSTQSEHLIIFWYIDLIRCSDFWVCVMFMINESLVLNLGWHLVLDVIEIRNHLAAGIYLRSALWSNWIYLKVPEDLSHLSNHTLHQSK